MTIDGGQTFETDAALVAHDDIHAIWIDPGNSNHLLIGNDGGVYESFDMSRTWTFMPNLPVGLFYHVSYDMETPYNVCGGMQDNYDWCGPERVAARQRHHELRLVPGAGRRRLRGDARPARLALSSTPSRRTAT